jgi:hypothetical protein
MSSNTSNTANLSQELFIQMDYQKRNIEQSITIIDMKFEIDRLNSHIKTLESDNKKKSDLICRMLEICKEKGIHNDIVMTDVILNARYVRRPISPPIRIPIVSDVSPSTVFEQSTRVDSYDYPPGIYDEIPLGTSGIRGGPQCSCMCRSFARQLCRIEDSYDSFLSPLEGRSLSISDVISRFNTNSDIPTLRQSIQQNMTRERAIHSFNMCKACNCCERHKRNFPVNFGVIERHDSYNYDYSDMPPLEPLFNERIQTSTPISTPERTYTSIVVTQRNARHMRRIVMGPEDNFMLDDEYYGSVINRPD